MLEIIIYLSLIYDYCPQKHKVIFETLIKKIILTVYIFFFEGATDIPGLNMLPNINAKDNLPIPKEDSVVNAVTGDKPNLTKVPGKYMNYIYGSNGEFSK